MVLKKNNNKKLFFKRYIILKGGGKKKKRNKEKNKEEGVNFTLVKNHFPGWHKVIIPPNGDCLFNTILVGLLNYDIVDEDTRAINIRQSLVEELHKKFDSIADIEELRFHISILIDDWDLDDVVLPNILRFNEYEGSDESIIRDLASDVLSDYVAIISQDPPPLYEFKEIQLSDQAMYKINNRTFWGGQQDLHALSDHYKVNVTTYAAEEGEIDSLIILDKHEVEEARHTINLFMSPGHWDLLIPANENVNQNLDIVLTILKNEIDSPLPKPKSEPIPKPKSEPIPKPKSEPIPKPIPKPKPKTEPIPKPKSKPKPKSESESKSKSEPVNYDDKKRIIRAQKNYIDEKIQVLEGQIKSLEGQIYNLQDNIMILQSDKKDLESEEENLDMREAKIVAETYGKKYLKNFILINK